MNEIDKTMLQIKNLAVNYGDTTALKDITLNIRQREYLGIIGPNGGGKTTLLRAILGLVPIASGSIRVYGKNKSPASIAYVPQTSGIDRAFPISVREVVLSGRLRQGLSPFYRYTPIDTAFADSMIEKVGLKQVRRKQVSELSGGEFRKMLIARALASQPKLLLLDEPTANVDAHSREQIFSLLHTLNAHMTILLVTHDIWSACAHATRLACFNKTLLYLGEPTLHDELIYKLYGHPLHIKQHQEAN